VHEEFAHDGDEGDFVGFTGGTQALINGLEDGVAARGSECSHVQRVSHLAASATDGAGSSERTAVAIKRGQSSQGRDFIFGQRPEFRHGSQQGRSGKGAHTLDLDEPGNFGAQVRVAFDYLGDAHQELLNLAVEMAHMQLQLGQRLGTGGLPQSDALADAIFDQLGAPGDEIVEQGHAWIGLGGGCGPHPLAVVCEQQGIDAVGLGELAAGSGEVTRQTWIDHTDGNLGMVKRGGERLVVRPGGFADDVNRPRTAGSELDQGSITSRAIGDGVGNGEMGTTQIDGGLGDIGTEVDRRGEHG